MGVVLHFYLMNLLYQRYYNTIQSLPKMEKMEMDEYLKEGTQVIQGLNLLGGMEPINFVYNFAEFLKNLFQANI